LIWYFCLKKLPYEFLIPYEQVDQAEEYLRNEFKIARVRRFEDSNQYLKAKMNNAKKKENEQFRQPLELLLEET
jgi:hypothetical protein